MSDEPKKIIVDDDWKAEARREKEKLAAQAAGPRDMPPPHVAELVNIIAMQAMAGMGLLATPNGERIPPDMEVAKHFIDLLQLLEDKTKGNLTPEEKTLLEQTLYDLRMTFVQIAGGGLGAVPGAGPAGAPTGSPVV